MYFTAILKKQQKVNNSLRYNLTYPASRAFSLAWLLVFTKSFVYLVCRIVGLFTPREKPLRKAARDFR